MPCLRIYSRTCVSHATRHMLTCPAFPVRLGLQAAATRRALGEQREEAQRALAEREMAAKQALAAAEADKRRALEAKEGEKQQALASKDGVIREWEAKVGLDGLDIAGGEFRAGLHMHCLGAWAGAGKGVDGWLLPRGHGGVFGRLQ